MVSTQPLPGPAAAPIGQKTALEVIKMFEGLGLPVCDDEAAIEKRFKEKSPVWIKMKSSPDPHVSAKGSELFKAHDDIKHRRAELLAVVYQFFARLGDTGLAWASTTAVKTLTPDLEAKLLNAAFQDCKVDDSLADRFIGDFMRSRNLVRGGAIVRPPEPVGDFTAATQANGIALSWTLPSRCDEVVLIREAEDEVGGPSENIIYRGRGTVFADRGGLEQGTWYRYRIHAVYQGVAGARSNARAVCVGEVRGAGAHWQDGQVALSWKLPSDDVSVAIFRREGGVPETRFGASGPEPASPSTRLVHEGCAGSWLDRIVEEGAIYRYRLICDFGQGIFSEGVDLQIEIPKRPPAPASLTARHERQDDQDLVQLEWPAVPRIPASYILVRRDGGAPPSSVDDGLILGNLSKTRFLDQTVVAGRRYSYAVFTELGDQSSRTGASAPPVDIIAEVAELSAQAGNGTVELSWRTPENVDSVMIRRSLGSPRDHHDGTAVRLSGAGHAKDEGLQNGKLYHYLVCCVYRPDGVTSVISAGCRISVAPDRMPDKVTDLSVRVEGNAIACAWKHEGHGQVIVVRSDLDPGLQVGTRLTADDANSFGERVVTTGSEAIDLQPDMVSPWYSVFTVAGTQAVFGGTVACVVCPDVSGLRLAASRDGIILRWVWPQDCSRVRIVRRENTDPAGPADPLAVAFSCSKSDYMNNGEKFVDGLRTERARFHYVVYAQPAGAAGVFFSPGADPGCRDVIQWEPWMTIRYRLEPASRRKSDLLKMTWEVENAFSDFAGFALVAGDDAPPTSGGVELFRWAPQGPCDGRHEAQISLAPVQKWARFYPKLIANDRAQSHAMLIIHPDVARPMLVTGRAETEHSRPIESYRPGVPKRVICPTCFREFPPGQIRFSSPGGAERLPGKHSWLNRLRGLPPRAPKDKQGRVLTRKTCPADDPLPMSAGNQASLVIGLIGAKWSGKTHYIASLVNRLQSQVGSDLQASLLAVNDETAKRYREEFHEPLFKSRFVLPLTVNKPPPLVYDLTIDGGLWADNRQRAVTLALYDTAGENLRSRESVEQMVGYLRVASGVIFLVDPLQVERVRGLLPASVAKPSVDPEAEPSAMLGRVIEALEQGMVVERTEKLRTPVAVVLTKCDVLRDAGVIEPNRLWSTDKRHVGYFDVEAHEDMSGMMAEYVRRWSPSAYNIVAQRFARYAFFGASATGCAADTNNRYNYVSPLRVEDPLLWLLAELGVLPRRALAAAQR